MWKAEIYIQPNSRWFSKSKLRHIGATEHTDGSFSISLTDKTYVTKVCERYRLKCNWYKKKWARSSNYREIFFRNNKEPYRCRYCHKRLSKSKVEVDHMMPVGKTKKSTFARVLLRLRGIDNVNSPKNLVASCHRCNEKKRDKAGFWYIRGVLGKYRIYWFVVGVIRLALLLGLCYVAYRGYLVL